MNFIKSINLKILIISIFFISFVVFADTNKDNIPKDILQFMMNLANESKDSKDNSTDTDSKKTSTSNNKGFIIHFGNGGDSHWYFSLGDSEENPYYNNSNHQEEEHVEDYLKYVMKKYDIDGVIVPLYYSRHKIGYALVTGSRYSMRKIDAVILRHERGNVVVNIPIDRFGHYISDIQVFAMQKIESSFPFYRRKDK